MNKASSFSKELATLLVGAVVFTLCFAGSSAHGQDAIVEPPSALELVSVPPISNDIRETVMRYQNVRTALVVNWIGDSLLISTRFGDTSQLHIVNSPLGMREQLTFSLEPIGGAQVRPQMPTELIYGRDVGGSESYQLFQMNLETRESTMLSDGHSRYTGLSYSPSGSRIAYTSTEINGRETDLFIQTLGGEKHVLQQGQGVGWYVESWALDEDRVLVSRYVSVVESELYEINLTTLKRTRLLEDHGSISIGSVAYSADGDSVLFTSFLNGENQRIFELNLATGGIRPITPEMPWDVSFFRLSQDRNLLGYVVNEGGYTATTVVDLSSGESIELPEFPKGRMSNMRFKPDNSQIAYSYQTPTKQTDVYVLDLETKSNVVWTLSEVGDLPNIELVSPQLLSYPSFDGREIPVFSFEPTHEGPHPVLIYIHGGPESQYRPGFSSTFQYYVNELGVAVLAPNIRGSNGYGKEYLGLDNGYLREDSVKDIGALLDFIATQENLDESRVAVMGGSYGGYMVLASLVHYSDRLKAGVETVGISNFVTFLENTQDYRRDLRRAEYGDERDPDMRAFLESIAPLNRVEQISAPLLIGQGLNDPRVPASESKQILEAMQARDIPVWYMLANDEGHGFRKKPNRDYWLYVVSVFLREHLVSS